MVRRQSQCFTQELPRKLLPTRAKEPEGDDVRRIGPWRTRTFKALRAQAFGVGLMHEVGSGARTPARENIGAALKRAAV
jgi:hypothetical protein